MVWIVIVNCVIEKVFTSQEKALCYKAGRVYDTKTDLDVTNLYIEIQEYEVE